LTVARRSVAETLFDSADFNPTLPGHPDPYPIYHRLRAEHPVFFSARMNGWVLSRYADALTLLHDQRFVRRGYIDGLRQRFGEGPLLSTYSHDLGFQDPPDHTRLRALVNKAFTPIAVERMRPRIQAIADRLIDRAASRGAMDVIADLAYPLPVAVISDMLGIPEEEREHCREWTHAIVVARGLVHTPEIMRAANDAMAGMTALIRELARARRSSPRDDLLSALVAAEESGDKLTLDELVATVASLYGAGHETTKNLIGNGVVALLRHHGELARLRAQPELIGDAVEEVLRFDSPTQAPPPRIARDDAMIGGVRIRAGDAVSVLLGAVNRDPAEFPEPDRFDITREPNRHLAFSMGIHFCLGAGLARVEAQVALATLIRRMPQLRLATDQIEWQVADRFRGPRAVPVRF
jgi:cytochrome P450